MTRSAFSRLFRRPAGIASVEYGFFAAVIAVGLLTIVGSIGGPMRVEIDPAAPVAALPDRAVATVAAPAEVAPPSAPSEVAALPDSADAEIAATDTAMEMVEAALVSLETVGTMEGDATTRSDIAAHDAAFEKLIQTLLIEETETVAAAPTAEADTRTAAIADGIPPIDPAAEPAADWIPATGYLDPTLKPMPRPDRLAAN